MAEKKASKKREIHGEKSILSALKKGTIGRYYVAPNVYLKVTAPDAGSWFTRFQYDNKRYEKKLGAYGANNPYLMSYKDALNKSADIQDALSANQHPLERDHATISTLNQLHETYVDSVKYSYEKQKEIYDRYFRDAIGLKLVSKITRADVERTIMSIVNTGYSSLAIKALYYSRSLFEYAHLHRFTIENVASHLEVNKHVGCQPDKRSVHLSEGEIESLFDVFHQYPHQAPIDNKIAVALYIIFGSRKSELLKSKWQDFDFARKEWVMRPTKTGDDRLVIDVPDEVMPLFYLLRTRAKGGNPYIFPTKGASKTGHISESTLNAMLKTFFSKHETKQVKFDNPLGKAGVQKFTVHDLRRTFATSANDNFASGEVTERCLNHKKKKGASIYDLSTRRPQRKLVYQLMSDIVMPLTKLEYDLEKYQADIDYIKQVFDKAS